MKVKCNYCTPTTKLYAFKSKNGYAMLSQHLKKRHPQEFNLDFKQQQITEYTTTTFDPLFFFGLFKYCEKVQREELAKMVVIEHRSFNFGKKLRFNKYCKNALNHAVKRVSRTTLTHTLKKII
jgi:hypothetical protein